LIADGARAVLDNRPAFLRTAKALTDFFAEVLEHGVSALSSRYGHALIVLRKLSQLSATDGIGEAIGQRSAFLSAPVPTLRAGHSQHCTFVVLIPLRHAGDDTGERTIEARHLQ